MDNYNGPHPSSGEEEKCDCDCDSSLQTQPSTPPVPNTSSDSQPPAKPPRSIDIPADPALALSRVGSLHTTKGSRCLQPKSKLPRRPEYGTLAKRLRTFYQETARWDPEGKPSVGYIATAGFYYDGVFKL